MLRQSLFALSGAALLALGACSQDKKTETTTTADTAVVTDTATEGLVDTTAYHPYADSLSRRVYTDLSLTDTTLNRKIRRVYHTRAHRLAVAKVRYASDTTGYYAALRQLNDDADLELKTLLDKDRYRVYQQNRAAYYQGTPYSAAGPTASTAGVGVKSVEHEKDGDTKIKYADGSKVKIGQDGDVKVKDAAGNKVKSGDDGLKVKK